MNDWVYRLWQEVAERPNGPLAVRFYLQPAMAAFFALRDGLKDAKAGRPAYFWELFSNAPHRRELIHDGWKSVGKVFILAAVLDVVAGPVSAGPRQATNHPVSREMIGRRRSFRTRLCEQRPSIR